MPGGGKLPDSCDHTYRILPCISASWQGTRYVVCTNKICDAYEWKSMSYISSHPLSKFCASENWPVWNTEQSTVERQCVTWLRARPPPTCNVVNSSYTPESRMPGTKWTDQKDGAGGLHRKKEGTWIQRNRFGGYRRDFHKTRALHLQKKDERMPQTSGEAQTSDEKSMPRQHADRSGLIKRPTCFLLPLFFSLLYFLWVFFVPYNSWHRTESIKHPTNLWLSLPVLLIRE